MPAGGIAAEHGQHGGIIGHMLEHDDFAIVVA